MTGSPKLIEQQIKSKKKDDGKQENTSKSADKNAKDSRPPFKGTDGSKTSKTSPKSKTAGVKSLRSSRTSDKTKTADAKKSKSKSDTPKKVKSKFGISMKTKSKTAATPKKSKSKSATPKKSKSKTPKPSSSPKATPTRKSGGADKASSATVKPGNTPQTTRPNQRTGPTQVSPGPGGAGSNNPGSSGAGSNNPGPSGISAANRGQGGGAPENPNPAGAASSTDGQGPSTAQNPTPGPSEPSGSAKDGSDVVFYLVQEIEGHQGHTSEQDYVKISRKAAMMSPLIHTMLYWPFPQKGSAKKNDADKKKESGNDSNASKRTFHGKEHRGSVVVPLSNTACTKETLQRIAEWCEHHQNDLPWDPSARIDDFEKDEWDLEDDRLKEPISYWDWNFITAITGRTIGDGAVWDPNRRAAFYDLMIAAYYLNLPGLVEMGGKFLCMQIKGKSMNDVVTMLNITMEAMPPPEGNNNANAPAGQPAPAAPAAPVGRNARAQ